MFQNPLQYFPFINIFESLVLFVLHTGNRIYQDDAFILKQQGYAGSRRQKHSYSLQGYVAKPTKKNACDATNKSVALEI